MHETMQQTITYTAVDMHTFPEWTERVSELHSVLKGLGNTLEEFGIDVDDFAAVVLAVMVIARQRSGPYRDVCMRSGGDIGDYLGVNEYKIYAAQKLLVEWGAVEIKMLSMSQKPSAKPIKRHQISSDLCIEENQLKRTIAYSAMGTHSFREWAERMQKLHNALEGIGNAMDEFGIDVDAFEAMVLGVMIIIRDRSGPYRDICMGSGAILGKYLGVSEYTIYQEQKSLVEWGAIEITMLQMSKNPNRHPIKRYRICPDLCIG